MCMYVHLDLMDTEWGEVTDLVGSTVLFTMKDAGRKFMKARNVRWALGRGVNSSVSDESEDCGLGGCSDWAEAYPGQS